MAPLPALRPVPWLHRMEAGFGNLPTFFVIAFGAVALFILAVLVMIVISAVRSRSVLRQNGLDPVAAHAQIAARLADGPLAEPRKPLEQRLAELDDLHRRGMITDAERQAGRNAALAER